MFEEIFFSRTAERYRAAPLVEQRERYLVHLRETGARRATLRKCANEQLSLVRLLDLKEGGRVRLSQIEAVTVIWSQPKARRCDRSASPKAKTRFVSRGIQWMRFLGWLDEPEREHHPNHAEVAIFEKWLRQERGLSTATIQDYCRAIDHFFCRLSGKGVLLGAVRMTDIDDVIAVEHKRGAWSRRTIHDYAQRIVRDRLAGTGIVTGRRGTHALRHAAAQHLLDQGISMKVIGDSTAIYAKVNLAALREVAALDLEGLA
jgi:integrase/recombinase XerD